MKVVKINEDIYQSNIFIEMIEDFDNLNIKKILGWISHSGGYNRIFSEHNMKYVYRENKFVSNSGKGSVDMSLLYINKITYNENKFSYSVYFKTGILYEIYLG